MAPAINRSIDGIVHILYVYELSVGNGSRWSNGIGNRYYLNNNAFGI